VPEQVGILDASSKFEDGVLVDDAIADRIEDMVDGVLAATCRRLLAGERAAELETEADD